MELTYQEAQNLLQERLDTRPEIKTLVSNPEFEEKLGEILDYTEISREFLFVIRYELLVVLAFYAPLNDLSQNIAESTGLGLEKTDRLALLIDTLLLENVRGDLENFQYAWLSELQNSESVPSANFSPKEKLELRPEGVPRPTTIIEQVESGPKPLTREEVVSALTGKRTMASDIDAVRGSQPPRAE